MLATVFFPFVALDGYIKEYLGSVRRVSHFGRLSRRKVSSPAIRKQFSKRIFELPAGNNPHAKKKGMAEAIPFKKNPLQVTGPMRQCRTPRIAGQYPCSPLPGWTSLPHQWCPLE